MRAPISKLHEALGRALREARVAAGLSQQQVADRAGHSRSFVAEAELGQRNITMSTLLALADALQSPAAALLEPVDRVRGR